MNADAKKFLSRTAKSTLAGGALVVTGFAAAADLSGASAQAAKSLDTGFTPLASTPDYATQRIVIGSNAAVGAQTLILRDQRAFVIGADAQEQAAPDGFYRLSNGQILKVDGGRVFQPSIVAMAGSGKWKDWLRKASGRAPAAEDVQSVYVSVLG